MHDDFSGGNDGGDMHKSARVYVPAPEEGGDVMPAVEPVAAE